MTMATALVSLLTERPIAERLAMTGEITLRGQVLPVGGIKQKVLAAARAGIETVDPAQAQRSRPGRPARRGPRKTELCARRSRRAGVRSRIQERRTANNRIAVNKDSPASEPS